MATVLHLPDSDMVIGYSPPEPLRERQILDVTLASLPTLLRYEDSNSMGNSIESRLPFCDYRVMECGVALPEAMKLRGGYGKWIVRRAMAGKIPEAIRIARYKKGFDVQEDHLDRRGAGRRSFASCSTNGRGRSASGSRRDVKIDELFSNEQFEIRPCRVLPRPPR